MRDDVGRLKRRAEFLRVAASRRKWAAPGLILQAADAPPAAEAANATLTEDGLRPPDIRVGFTCSKKVGNAVARNRAKRRLRACAREIIGLEGLPSHDYVLIGREATLHRPYALLLEDLRTALKRVQTPRPPKTKPAGTDEG
jgi:ribonuclease P protein component